MSVSDIVLLYKTSILRESGIAPLPFGIAAVKALILGKFMLIGTQVHLGARLKARSLLHLILRTALMYLLLLVVLTILEEFVVGWIHGHAFAQTLAEFGQRSSRSGRSAGCPVDPVNGHRGKSAPTPDRVHSPQ